MLLVDQFGDPLKIVAAAVAPVVMVSATAILISVTNARYTSVADRVRMLTREFRDTGTSQERQANIRLQMGIFHRRLHLASWAARVLYAAVGCFVVVALLISISASKTILLGLTPWMFLVGLVLIACAIVLQLLELHQSNRLKIHKIPTKALNLSLIVKGNLPDRAQLRSAFHAVPILLTFWNKQAALPADCIMSRSLSEVSARDRQFETACE